MIKTEIIKNRSANIINIIILVARAVKYKKIVNNWTEVLTLARKVTLVAFEIFFLALKSLKALTHISLEIINAAQKANKKLDKVTLRVTRRNTTNILSAIGSNISPISDDASNFLAK